MAENDKPAPIPHPDRDSAVKVKLAKGYSAFCLKDLVQRQAGEDCWVHPNVLKQHPAMRDRGEIIYSGDAAAKADDEPPADGVPVFQTPQDANPFGDPVPVKSGKK